jgi:cell division septal protein FtsQ
VISLRQLKKKILAGWLFSWRRQAKHGFRPPTFTQQKYTPFHAISSQTQSVFRSRLKQIFSRLQGFRRTHVTGRDPQKTARRISLAKSFAILIGCVALLYAGRGWLMGFMSGVEYFEVQSNVVIEGCRVTSPAEIRELGEIRYHTNLFGLDLRKLEAIIGRHPWVSEVKAQRDWPNRLLVRIVEHTPEALILNGDPGKQQLYYMDMKGVPFVPVKPGQDIDFPVVTGVENMQDPAERKAILGDVAHFLKLIKTNNPNLPAQSVSEIHLDKAEGMVVYLVENPFPIFFGTGSVGKKYKQLQDVLGVLYKQRKEGMLISQVEYIRMDYLTNKVLVAQSGSG